MDAKAAIIIGTLAGVLTGALVIAFVLFKVMTEKTKRAKENEQRANDRFK